MTSPTAPVIISPSPGLTASVDQRGLQTTDDSASPCEVKNEPYRTVKHGAVLAAGTFSFRDRVPAVARALGLSDDVALLSKSERQRLIHALFDPSIAASSIKAAP